MQVGDDDDTQQNNVAQTAADDTASAADQQDDNSGSAQDEAGQGSDEGNALTAATGGAAQQQEQPKPKNPSKAYQSRIDELTRNWRGTQRDLDAANARIAELESVRQQSNDQQEDELPQAARRQQQSDVVPANMVDQLADQRAQAIADKRQFDNDCNLTFMKGKAAYQDWEDALDTFKSLGGLDQAVVEDALATDAPHDVLYQLGKDEEEAMRVLKLPRAKRIAEFTKMTLKQNVKPAVSKASAPIKPVGGTTKPAFDYADDNAEDATWFANRDKDRRAAGRI
jgi:hypothetical protein